ncbi:MAG: hypothetical protein IBX55_00495 [Methyloprofundus sp.]|nr:hypothetical protein [Methyloprofundus sp.]
MFKNLPSTQEGLDRLIKKNRVSNFFKLYWVFFTAAIVVISILNAVNIEDMFGEKILVTVIVSSFIVFFFSFFIISVNYNYSKTSNLTEINVKEMEEIFELSKAGHESVNQKLRNLERDLVRADLFEVRDLVEGEKLAKLQASIKELQPL